MLTLAKFQQEYVAACTKYKISMWYDTVTPESAEHGDFESCGNDWQEYLCDSLEDAEREARDHVGAADSLSELLSLKLGKTNRAMLYPADAQIDYTTGNRDYPTACIERVRPSLTGSK